MEDIMYSVAWHCGNKDGCAQGWHKSNYWAYDDGTYSVDSYSDGDHETIDGEDLPALTEVEDSWREYAKDVVATGADPLGQYFVKHALKVRERWQFKFGRSIVGPVLAMARHAGREWHRGEVPEHVRQYLNLSGYNARLADFADWQAFTEALPGVRPGKWETIYIDRDIPRAPAAVGRELRRVARRGLK